MSAPEASEASRRRRDQNGAIPAALAGNAHYATVDHAAWNSAFGHPFSRLPLGAGDVRLVLDTAVRSFQFGLDEMGHVFAVAREGPRVAVPVSGRAFRQALLLRFVHATGRTPKHSAVGDAFDVLSAVASVGVREPLPLRVVRMGQAIAVDLADATGRSVSITPAGWEILDRSPVVWRRTEVTGPMQTPLTHGRGSLDALRDVLNIAPRHWGLLVGYLVAGLFGSMSNTSARSATSRSGGDMAPPPSRQASYSVEECHDLRRTLTLLSAVDVSSGLVALDGHVTGFASHQTMIPLFAQRCPEMYDYSMVTVV